MQYATVGYVHLNKRALIHIDQRTVPFPCLGGDTCGFQCLQGLNTRNRTLSHSHFSSGLLKCMSSCCYNLRMCGNTLARVCYTSGIGLEQQALAMHNL